MERGDVPRDVGRDARDERSEPRQFVARVVEARNEQRDDLDPKIHGVQTPDGVEDWLETAAKLAIVASVEALEIDLVEIDPGAQVVQHLRRPVAVGHVAGNETGGLRFLEHRHRPLARDQRLVVSAHHDACAQAHGVAYEIFGRCLEGRRHRRRIAQRLRGDPVLTVRAVQIAAEHAKAVREGARIRVKERLLLDRIALHAANVPPRHEQPSAFVEPHLAHADRTFRKRAAMAAGVATEPAVGQLIV